MTCAHSSFSTSRPVNTVIFTAIIHTQKGRKHYMTQTMRETGVRTIHITGVPIAISHQRGGIIIWGNREHQGLSITLRGRAYGTASGEIASATFTPYRTKNGRMVTVARLPRLVPGNYTVDYTPVALSQFRYEDVTVTAAWVSEMDMRRR
jgi:hypothetical protein